ncbi:MAG TPA: 50S ribosomal protein L30 [Anaerolineae bacterium]|nr:50S ribosomal protein L30 [Anaerolineae bacterium]
MSARKRKKKKVLRITLTKSPIGYSERQKQTVRALGLRRMNQAVEQADTQVIRGMVAKVQHLVKVEEVEV